MRDEVYKVTYTWGGGVMESTVTTPDGDQTTHRYEYTPTFYVDADATMPTDGPGVSTKNGRLQIIDPNKP